jgi:hypothetical protein
MRSLLPLTFALLIASGAQAALPPLDGAFINVEQKNLSGAVTDLANRNCRIIIVQYSSNTYGKATRIAELDTIFKTADDLAKREKKLVDVYVGLYFDENWNDAWEAGTEALEPFLRQNTKTIKDIDTRYGDHPRFKGWYIAHEIGNAAVPADVAATFFGRLANECRAYDKKRGKERLVLVSAYFNPRENYLQPEQFAKSLSTIDKCANFSRILLQDGVGTRQLDPTKLTKIVTPLYDHVARAVGKNRVWGVIELFCCAELESDCQCKDTSGRGADKRLQKQVDAITKHVIAIIAFEFNDISEKPSNCGPPYCNTCGETS